jgi:hypothetical protein
MLLHKIRGSKWFKILVKVMTLSLRQAHRQTDDRRPEFQRMMDAAAQKSVPFELIIVHSFPRCFRDHDATVSAGSGLCTIRPCEDQIRPPGACGGSDGRGNLSGLRCLGTGHGNLTGYRWRMDRGVSERNLAAPRRRQ